MVLILTIATCLMKAGIFLLDFLVKLMHELSYLVQSLTPIAIALINTLAKCIGGFYWLIFMLWKGNSTVPQRPYPNQLALTNSSMRENRTPMIGNYMSNSYQRPTRKSWDRRSSGNQW